MITWKLPFTALCWVLLGASDLTLAQVQPVRPAVPLPGRPAANSQLFVPPIPPNRGAPGRRKGAASRGECLTGDKSLTALVPATEIPMSQAATAGTPTEAVWGLTVAERPTLWFYVPDALTSEHPLEFVLLDEQDNYLYKTSFTAARTPSGIISLSLPATVAPLVVGKQYHWFFSVYCGPQQPGRYMSVNGSIQRVVPNATLKQQLVATTQAQRIPLYAAHGIWHEALTTVAQLRRADPHNAALAASWRSLLKAIDLETLAAEPLVPCCTPSPEINQLRK
ncbi:MAG TPA: DUF928 domain-containing protein [Candidatus Caenarcaniphilales bacterium]